MCTQRVDGIIVTSAVKNKDKRNTDSHRRKHDKLEDSHYECDKCRKKMKYSMQFKCHWEQGCEL